MLLKSIRLEYNLLPKGGKKVENFDFWGIFELFDQTGYCFIFGPKGDKSPSLVKICTFCRLVFVIFFVWILLSFWLNDWRLFDHISWSYKTNLNFGLYRYICIGFLILVECTNGYGWVQFGCNKFLTCRTVLFSLVCSLHVEQHISDCQFVHENNFIWVGNWFTSAYLWSTGWSCKEEQCKVCWSNYPGIWRFGF